MVGETFEEVVGDREKNVLVLFYNSWNAESNTLLGVYNQLAMLLSGEEDVQVAKMDAITNEVESVVIHELPYLVLYKAGEKEAVEFEGEMTLEAMEAFVTKNRAVVEEEEL